MFLKGAVAHIYILVQLFAKAMYQQDDLAHIIVYLSDSTVRKSCNKVVNSGGRLISIWIHLWDCLVTARIHHLRQIRQ